MTDEFRDLFGQPLAGERGQGRPEYVWSEEKSNRVNMLFASGYEPKDVAPVLGCCLKTFRKVFFRECADWRNAKLKFRSRQMLRLNDQAEAGNVAAEKALAGMIQAEQVKAMQGRVLDRSKAPPAPKKPALGKKDQASHDAKNLSGQFGTRPPPPLLMN